MAVYKRSYRGYTGARTSEWSRFAVIPRYAYRDLFHSKIMTAFFVLCYVAPLILLFLIYFAHSWGRIAALFGERGSSSPIAINEQFFLVFLNIQAVLAFILTAFVGPGLISSDLANRALPLYLCRPFSRAEYVLGKMSVLLILLSLITWIPQLLLFLFQSYLEGASWFVDNLWIASAIFIGSAVWILLLALLSQAVSALVKWRVVASAALLGIFFIPSVFGEFINVVFWTRWGHIVSLGALMKNVSNGLFGTFVRTTGYMVGFDGGVAREVILNEPPLWCSWAALFVICAICLALLSKKVK